MKEMDRGQKKKNRLSDRQIAILTLLVKMEGRPLTVRAVSETLKVSVRTVLRDIPGIKAWMDNNDFLFSSKTGVGMQIEESPENLDLIGDLLKGMGEDLPSLGRQERRRQILGELLAAGEPVKAFALTSRYGISEGTLYSDLEHLEPWLKDYHLEVVRRQGLGIFLRGDERNIRQAMANSLFEYCDLEGIPFVFANFSPSQKTIRTLTRHPAMVFLEPAILTFVAETLADVEEWLHVRYMESSKVRLLVRLTLAIYRMSQGCFISQKVTGRDRIAALAELSISRRIADRIKEEFFIEMPEAEIDYLAMYLASTRLLDDGRGRQDPLQRMNLRQVVVAMTGVMEQMTGYPFRENPNMIDDLVRHIEMLEKRSAAAMIVENLQVDKILGAYPEIEEAAKAACEVLREWISPGEIKDKDIDYIAMHYVAEAERIQESLAGITAVVVCPAGIGSSKMLAVSVKRAFHMIEIPKVMSAFSINEEELEKEGIDLIISTVEIESDFPHICVGNLLDDSDKRKLQKEIDKITRHRIEKNDRKPSLGKGIGNLGDIRRQTDMGREILELVDHLTILEIEEAIDLDDLYKKAGELFAGNEDQARSIEEAFRKRETLGSTYSKGLELCLLHCLTPEADHCRFGYVGLKEALLTRRGEKLLGAVVMVAPAAMEARELLEPLGRLSSLLVEERGFLQALKRGDTAGAAAFAEESLVKYYRNQLYYSKMK